MRRIRATLGAALLVGAAVTALLPSSAAAATLTQSGWWWRVNDGALPVSLPSPPNVPEGGLMVAGAPDGATAIAALHFDLSETEASPVLTLRVADGGDQGGAGALLGACVTGSVWQPESAGTWTNKPFPACAEGSVNGVRADDGASWTFALAPLLSDGILDITLVPGVDPAGLAGANGSVFQLVFAAPSAASLVTSTGSTGDADFDVPSFDASGGDDGSFDSPSFGGDLGARAGLRLHTVAARDRSGPHRHGPSHAAAQRATPRFAHLHGRGPSGTRGHRAGAVRRCAPLVCSADPASTASARVVWWIDRGPGARNHGIRELRYGRSWALYTGPCGPGTPALRIEVDGGR